MDTNNKIKKSAVIAFLELLSAVEAGNEEVLLLRSCDKFANEVVQNYNDALHDFADGHKNEYVAKSTYLPFMNRLAKNFHRCAETAVPIPPMFEGEPDKEAMAYLASALYHAANKILAQEADE